MNKLFLRGFGTGLVVASVILCIAYRTAEKDHISKLERDFLNKHITAVESNSVEVSANDLLKQNQEKNASGQAVDASGSQDNKTTDSSDTEQASGEKVISKTKQDLTDENNSIEEAKKYYSKTQKVKVPSADTSTQVARELEKAGVIKDAIDFDYYLSEHGYSKSIRTGEFKIPKGTDYDGIAKIITKTTDEQ